MFYQIRFNFRATEPTASSYMGQFNLWRLTTTFKLLTLALINKFEHNMAERSHASSSTSRVCLKRLQTNILMCLWGLGPFYLVRKFHPRAETDRQPGHCSINNLFAEGWSTLTLQLTLTPTGRSNPCCITSKTLQGNASVSLGGNITMWVFRFCRGE